MQADLRLVNPKRADQGITFPTPEDVDPCANSERSASTSARWTRLSRRTRRALCAAAPAAQRARRDSWTHSPQNELPLVQPETAVSLRIPLGNPRLEEQNVTVVGTVRSTMKP